ncbi:MAG: acyl-CoA dehydrogenase family protein [Microbacterium sp.]
MEFDFDDDQYAFRDAIRAFLQQRFPAARLRELWSAGGSDVRTQWAGLAESGVIAVAIGEEFGGGGSLLDLALPLEELGYAAAPEGLALAAGVVAPAVSQYASAVRCDEWLEGLAGGDIIPSLVLAGQRVVLGAQDADVFLVQDDDGLLLAPRVELRVGRLRTQDGSLRAGTVDGDIDERFRIASGRSAAEAVRSAARAVTASTMVGSSQRLIDMTRDYVLVREQFGTAIGSFQAVKHRLADAAVQLEAARSLAWWAHYCLVHDERRAAVASMMAKDAANAAATLAGYAALQLHGGIGFTWEHDLHLWLQRGKALQHLFGSSDDLRLELGDRFLAEVVA